jgi:hypothetical protein
VGRHRNSRSQIEDNNVVPPQRRLVAAGEPYRGNDLHSSGFLKRRCEQPSGHSFEIQRAGPQHPGGPCSEAHQRLSACPMSTPTASAMSSSRRSAPGSICRGSTPISAAPSWRSRRERQANALYNAAFAAVDALRMFRACVHRSPKRRGRAMTGALPNDLYATPRGPAAAPHRASAQARPRDLDRRRRLARSAAGHASRDRPIRGVVRRCLRRTVRAAPMMT